MTMQSKNQIFVYGTLSFPEILSALLGRKVSDTPARIKGYKRVRISNKVYPGLIAADGEVEGDLHKNLSEVDLALLDAFEDDFYDRVSVIVQLPDGQNTQASTYTIAPKNLSFAADELWDREEFAKQYLLRYLDMVAQYRQDYLHGHTKSQDFSSS